MKKEETLHPIDKLVEEVDAFIKLPWWKARFLKRDEGFRLLRKIESVQELVSLNKKNENNT